MIRDGSDRDAGVLPDLDRAGVGDRAAGRGVTVEVQEA